MLVPSIMPLLSSSTGFSRFIRVAGANFSPPQHFGSNNISFRAVLYAPGKRAIPLSEISQKSIGKCVSLLMRKLATLRF